MRKSAIGLQATLKSGEAKIYLPALEATEATIDGFQSPLGMELLATVEWLLQKKGIQSNVAAVKEGALDLAWRRRSRRKEIEVV